MRYRELGRTGWKVSEVSFGAWAIGSMWGRVDDNESLAALHRAIDLGVNFIDTADVYGMGHSERLIAQLRNRLPGFGAASLPADRGLLPTGSFRRARRPREGRENPLLRREREVTG